MHERKWFKGVGMLEYLSPEEFYNGPWIIVMLGVADQYGDICYIVRNTEKFEFRYVI